MSGPIIPIRLNVLNLFLSSRLRKNSVDADNYGGIFYMVLMQDNFRMLKQAVRSERRGQAYTSVR